MKNLIYYLSLVVLLILVSLVSCDNSSEEPEPTTLRFNTTSATFDGNDIDPTPSYTLTVNFDGDGNPTSYSATGSTRITPTPGNGGDWSISGTVITFTDNGGAQREVNGSINASSSTISLDYDITKLDEGVITDEVGNYVFNMSLQ